MKKKEARNKFLDLRKQLSKEEIDKLNFNILENLKKLPIWDKEFYHIFLPMTQKNEINTYPIIHYLWAQKKTVCIQKISSLEKNTMDCIVFKKNTSLKLNKYKFYEPFEGKKINPLFLQVSFTPLLSFDLLGHRVGYGKGFYDRFYKNCKKNLIKIGLSFFNPIDKIKNFHKEDVSLDKCVTPYKNYNF